MAIRIQLLGGKELDRQLKALDKKMGKKIVRSAVRKAAKPVLATVKSLVPVKSGRLKKSLKN